MKLSVLMPVYNEKKSILEILRRVKEVDLGDVKKEIIVVDDFSNDGTRFILEGIKDKEIKVFFHRKNYGKGRAVRTALEKSTGEIVIIQDADLEYDPNDYSKLIKPIIEGKSKVVYGSRILGNRGRKGNYSHFSFYIGGRVVSLFTNILFGSRLTDEPTCYKVFERGLLKGLNIEGERFEWEPEVTAKILKRGIRIDEIPISYFPRNKKEGKKINWKDGVNALWTLLRYRFND